LEAQSFRDFLLHSRTNTSTTIDTAAAEEEMAFAVGEFDASLLGPTQLTVAP